MDKRTKGKASIPARTMIDEVFALARKMGWRKLNDDEENLIETLRHTTYKGRNIVLDVAFGMRRLHPWIEGDPRNTEE